MALYKCKICGKLFERVGNGVYCNGPHYRPCKVCGKPVAYSKPSEPYKCCSKECTQKLAAESKSKAVRVCKECRKEFHPNQGTQIYCPGPHTAKCVICGKEFTYTVRPSEKPQTCSRKCQEALRSRTAQERYGVSNVSELPEVRKKISEANGSEEVKAKRAATSMARWGVYNPSMSEEVRKKLVEVMNSEEYLRKREQTCIERYGFPSPSMADSIKQKRIATNIERYGTAAPPMSKEARAKIMVDGSKIDEYLAFKADPKTYIMSHFSELPTITQLQSCLGVTDTPIYDALVEHNCRELISKNYSTIETDIYRSILSACPDIELHRCDRTVIRPDEIDIYVPAFKVGIECNPGCTHNSSFVDPWGGPPKSYRYHKDKSDKAAAAGVFLFHVFGYEWRNKRAIMKSMILNLLGCSKYRYGARETYVCELSGTECKQFLDANHRQGNCNSTIRLGLKLKKTDELVAVMTFGHLRPTMGKTAQTDDTVWELSRFCNKLYTNVIGGASKLLAWFKSHYAWSSIISFSDVAHTRGTLYQTLGFTKVGEVPPSYTWVDQYDNIYYNRVSCQKHNLAKLLHDDTIDIEHYSEVEIMEAHNFCRVYDSGKIKWELTCVSL